MGYDAVEYDAVVVGSGPNGLAAAITVARAGGKVLLLEGKDTLGGGMRSAALTLPGFCHDVGSAIHPLGVASPFFRGVPLEQHGLRWVHPDAPLAHPLDGGGAVLLERSLAATGAGLGKDGAAYEALMQPIVARWDTLAESFLGPLLRVPYNPFPLARFGLRAVQPSRFLARRTFRGEPARALLAGVAAHALLPLETAGTSAIALVLAALGHVVGWPMPQGGAQTLADALERYFCSLGGEVVISKMVTTLAELPPARVVLLDVNPEQLPTLAGGRLPARYRRWLGRYRRGAGVFKVDYALDAPIPWQNETCLRAGTVHLGGTLAEVAASERAVAQGRVPERPYVLVAQHTLFDKTRAPAGKHTCWAYCHVPNGSAIDMTGAIEGQLERFAPGFRERVLARHTMNTRAIEAFNPNYVGGDINGGAQTLWQMVARPVPTITPYLTPLRGVYLCSASTPPGGGVHGMSGYHAAQAALRRELRDLQPFAQ